MSLGEIVIVKFVQQWLDKLGYLAEPTVLHQRGDQIAADHPYALELKSILRTDGAIRAQAVFDVEGVPTVVFVGDDDAPLTEGELDDIRKRIWNQNLATVVIEIKGDKATALPARKLANAFEVLHLDEARPDGRFSAFDLASANLSRRVPAWFDINARVDHKLLANLSSAVDDIAKSGFTSAVDDVLARHYAELLLGQVLFVSYLEHREIVGATYRQRRQVELLFTLVAGDDRQGVGALIDALRQDFNGDFLGDDRHDPWSTLNSEGFRLLHQFLSRTDMRTGQGDFWNYDFSYIPVELLSGLYESFLAPDQQAKDGAYYTPRHLAMLAVDQAFAGSADPLRETIFDGACGSGILLTTAYRRLIALSEARDGQALTFKGRSDLLIDQIYGGDINPMACRVTAFSLYLSLLEGLAPSDIMEAQDREGVKLPSLAGKNLRYGEHADFFGENHDFETNRFSLIISNPPWAEPEGEDITSADRWAERVGAPFVRRQIAGAYALRAMDFLAEGGRVCLILPIGQFLGGSSAKFVSRLLEAVRPRRLINFGDLQGLLFPTAENTCHLFLGERRGTATAAIPFGETFDYCVPKADMSLAFGRLTMQSADRHVLQTRSVAQNPQLLVTLMWGDSSDMSLLTRLTVRGTFGDFWKGPRAARRWVNRKGVHLNDKSRVAVSAEPLSALRFVPVPALSAGSPVLHPDLLSPWPEAQKTVVGLNEDLMAVFDGPRVLFPDGFSKQEQNVRAVYYDGPAVFTHSIGVIAGSAADADLLKFAAVFLRSRLARYFLMMHGWKMLCERSAVHLADVEAFPFFDIDDAPDPLAAQAAVDEVVAYIGKLQQISELAQKDDYRDHRDALDEAVCDYFGLDEQERRLIYETVDVLMPSIRPRSFASLDTPAQQSASPQDFEAYGESLGLALTLWRERMGGQGRFVIDVVASDPARAGPMGIVRISHAEDATVEASTQTTIDDDLVIATLAALRRDGLSTISSGDAIQLVPDAHIWIDDALYLVRPLARRGWTLRQALRDAEYVVRSVQQTATPNKFPEVA